MLPIGQHQTRKSKINAGLNAIQMEDEARERRERRGMPWPFSDKSEGWVSSGGPNVAELSAHRPARANIEAIERISLVKTREDIRRDKKNFKARMERILNPKKLYTFKDFDS